MSITTTQLQRTILVDARLDEWFEAFIIDRKARGLSPGTIRFYRLKLRLFLDWAETQAALHLEDITPVLLREFLLHLEERGHSPGGRHACYRTLKAFLRWFDAEVEPEGWRNPIAKVSPPRQQQEPLAPVTLETVKLMLESCNRETLLGARDAAILLFLIDTGARAAELCDMDIGDLDRTMGSALIRHGKGGKPRAIYLGKRVRRALRKYLRLRSDSSPALWTTRSGSRMQYAALRDLLKRRALEAKVATPTPHDFRRAFALESLRNGIDVYSLQRLMGHSDLQVLRRYLAQTGDDIRVAHGKASPADNW